MGGHYKNHIKDIHLWCEGEKRACDTAGIRYWINNEIFRDEDIERYPDRDPVVPVAPFEEVIEQVKQTDIAETHLFFTLTWYGTRNVIDHWSDLAKQQSLEFYEKMKKYCDKNNHPERFNEKKKSYWWILIIIIVVLIIIGGVGYYYKTNYNKNKDMELLGSVNV